ncbi:hypothetical protein EC957_005184 [Mortierella hygrophila]|uniref:F-box domain-containing protein n=1 Tax=Mortierella hygrophila TaxID=979708 RepID=A0A9P6JZV9_9FUNG|nr:hypothetical protein EC957_005184 [Mortierella hygrophila]
MATAACDTFFDLPELVCHLTNFLSQHDLIKLLQLNHHINTICTPELWRTLSRRIGFERLLDSPLALRAFSRNINSVKSIAWNIDISTHYIKAVWAYLNSTAVLPEHQSISTDVLSNPMWGGLTLPTVTSIHPLPPMLRLTHYSGHLSNADYIFTNLFEPDSPQRETHLHHPHQTLWLLQLNRSTLTHLTLYQVPLTLPRIRRHICRTLSQLIHLQTLRLGAPWHYFIAPQAFDALFSSCPRSLVEFSFRAEVEYLGGDTNLTPDEDDWDFDQLPLVPSTEPFHCLTRLEFPKMRSMGSTQALFIVPILMLCPALETLDLPAIKDAQTIKFISMALSVVCPLVTDMSLVSNASVREGGEDVMGIMQQISPGHRLRDIYLISCFDNALPSTTAAGFLQHAESLRRIELRNSRLLKSATIQTILVSCQGLEHLKIEENVSSNDCALHLEDATLAEWRCTRIRYLELTIAFTPDGRDPKYFAADPTMATWTEEDHHHWDLMDRLYTQIGALSKLVVLKLKAAGVPRQAHTLRSRQRGDNFKETCLPGLLSLEDPTSGKIGFLSRLSGLTKLRELRGSLFWTNKEVLARTGEREVEWFVNHLPALRRMVLLFHPGLFDAVQGEEELPWVIEELRRRRPGLLLDSDRRDEYE